MMMKETIGVILLLLAGVAFIVFQVSNSEYRKPSSAKVPGQMEQAQAVAEPTLADDDVDISSGVTKHRFSADGLDFTSWHFQKPLLPDARLIDFRDFEGRFWFSGDSGLLSFDPETETWFSLSPQQGLPGDTVYGIELDGDKLFVEVYNWSESGSLSAVNDFHFSKRRFSVTRGSEVRAKAGGIKFPKTTKITAGISDVLKRQDSAWFSYRGSHSRDTNQFRNGGVVLADTNGAPVREFTTEDGIASSYCNSLAATADGDIWVSHWDEERGLSRFNQADAQWTIVQKSVNGIELGGVSVHSQGQFLFIAQQRGLVIYDTETLHALLIEEEHGLPGYIVTDVQFDRERAAWVSAYSYGQGGQSATGLSKFNHAMVVTYFDQFK